MEFTPVSEGFLDLFKKKIKEPAKVEKSTINERMKPANPLIDANTKLMEMYPEDTAKEFKKRKDFLKTLLNVITEASKKFKDTPGIGFSEQIDTLKAFIQEKDYDADWGYEYADFAFMHDLIPPKTPSEPKDECYGFGYNWFVDLFRYDINVWAENCKDAEDFKSNKKLVRDFNDTKEWYTLLENVCKFFESKLNNKEFVYLVTCGGDWDDGPYCVSLKPSKEIQELATRCSSFKKF